MIKAKVRGWQLTMINRLAGDGGQSKRSVFYTCHLEEITVDTSEGSFIISHDDLEKLLVRKIRRAQAEKKSKMLY